MSGRLLRLAVCGLLAALLLLQQLSLAQTPPPTPTPAKIKTRLSIPVARDFGPLTPFASEGSYFLMSYVYDTLYWRDTEGVPRPWLATSAMFDQTNREMTLALADARWHDGMPVTSADVAFSFQHFVLTNHPRFAPQLRAIGAIETPDARTLKIQLRFTFPGFLDQPLSDVPIIPKHEWASLSSGESVGELVGESVGESVGDSVPASVIGSGPFRLVDYNPGDIYRLEANETYFRGSPHVAGIDAPIIRSTETRVRAFEQGDADLVSVAFPSTLPGRVGGAHVKITEGDSYVGIALIMNVRKVPFDRTPARLALAKAIDTKRLTSLVGKAAEATHGHIHPESPFAEEEIANKFDKDEAKRDLESLGISEIQLISQSDDLLMSEMSRFLAIALRQLRLKVTERKLIESEYLRSITQEESPAEFSVALARIPDLVSHDPSYLIALFGDAEVAPFNSTGFRSADLDDALRRVISDVDPQPRQSAITDALRILGAEKPSVPILFVDSVNATRLAAYRDWVFTKGSSTPDKRSFVDPPLTPSPTTRGTTVTVRLESKRKFTFGPGTVGLVMATVGLLMVAFLAVRSFRGRRG